jgi:hypothetical protein
MLGRIIRIAANAFLRRRSIRTGSGPRRLPPTSMREAQSRVVRTLINKFMRR